MADAIVDGAGRGTATFKVNPTLLIGLGGSGWEVLMRMRGFLYDRWRTAELPMLSYLWFDTDPNQGRVLQDAELDPALEWKEDQVRLPPEAIYNANVPSDAVQAMKMAGGMGGWRHMVGQDGWFAPQIWDSLGANIFDNGANQVRSVGRLAFYYHYSQGLRTKLEGLVEGLHTSATDQAVKDFPFEMDTTKTEVIIVGSLAGGTGSGCLIDMACLVQDVFQKSGRGAFITGIFFLTDLFEERVRQADVIRANAAAALTELDYWVFPGSRDVTFDAYWDGDRATKCPLPPYNGVSLIGRHNDAGRTMTTAQTLDMVGKYLAYDFDESEFATSKRSARSNTASYMSQKVRIFSGDSDHPTYQETHAASYASFGMSEITIDQRRIANAAGFWLASQLTGFWIHDKGVPDIVDGHVAPLLDRAGLTLAAAQARVTNDTIGNADRFTEHVVPETTQWYEATHTALLAETLADDVQDQDGATSAIRDMQTRFTATAREQIAHWDGRTVSDLREATTGQTIGPAREQIGVNAARAVSHYEDQIRSELLQVLGNPTAEFGGYAAARELLTGARARLERLRDDVRTRVGDEVARPEFHAGDPPSVGDVVAMDDPAAADTQRWSELLNASKSAPWWDSFPLGMFMRQQAAEAFQKKHTDAKASYENAKDAVHTANRSAARLAAEARFDAARGELARLLDECRVNIMAWVRDRYVRTALGYLVRDGETNTLGGLLAAVGAIGTRQEDGRSVNVYSGLQQQVNDLHRVLVDLTDHYKKLHAAFATHPQNTRDHYLDAVRDYEEEIRAYLEPKIAGAAGASNTVEFVSHAIPEWIRATNRDLGSIFAEVSNEFVNTPEYASLVAATETYAIDRLRDFKDDVSVASVFNRMDPVDKTNSIAQRIRFSGPAIRTHAAGHAGLVSRPESAWQLLGTADESMKAAAVNASVEGNNPFNPRTSTGSYKRDRVVFFQDVVGLPLFRSIDVDGYEAAMTKHVRDVPDNVYLRYSEKNHERYPSIIPVTASEEGAKRAAYLKALFEGALLGAIDWQRVADSADGGHWELVHMSRELTSNVPRGLGGTFRRAMAKMDDDLLREIQARSSEFRDRGRASGAYDFDLQMLALCGLLDESAHGVGAQGSKNLSPYVVATRVLHAEWFDDVRKVHFAGEADPIKGAVDPLKAAGQLERFAVKWTYEDPLLLTEGAHGIWSISWT